MNDLSFNKTLRLLQSSEFKAVFDDAQFKVSDRHLLMLARSNDLDCGRLGLVIAKKNVRKAVQRNRVKRICRETFRLSQPQLLQGVDTIVLARRGLDELSNPEMHALINKLWQRLARQVARKRQ